MAGIWIILGGVLAAGYGLLTRAPVSVPRTAIKTGATICLGIAAITGGAPVWVVIALTFGALGDVFLSRDPDRWFLPGLVAFAFGHAVYSAGFWGLSGTVSVGGALVLAGLAAALIAWLWRTMGALRWPVVGYAGLSVALGGIALAQPNVWLACGALAFIASDVILAISLFGMSATAKVQKVLGPLLWALYWGGQAAILWGAVHGL